MYRKIVHANDGSANSFKALKAALDLANLCGARLDVLIVEELYPHSGSIYEVRREKAVADRQAEQQKRRIQQAAESTGVPYDIRVFTGPPVAFITEYVHEVHADLLVIGATEHVSMIELVIGRRQDRLAHGAECSVMIVR